MKQKICVIGCGWLGLPLAKKLIENDYTVYGSTTSQGKIETIENAGIIPFLIHISSEGISGNIQSCLETCKTLIVNIPPGLRKDPESNYIKKMTHFINFIEKSSVENVLFIGSTSVYDDSEKFPIITETSPTSNSKTALQLVKVEALFKNNKNFKTTILRFSGLFGNGRHPAKYLSGKTELKNGDAPVNLIHRDDCVSIIISVVKNNIWDNDMNASTPSHPTKKEYYSKVCDALNIAKPQYMKACNSKGKIIDSQKLVHILNYTFQVNL